MNYTAISLCSRALVKLGATSISSFNESTTEAQVAAQLYSPVLEGLLAQYPWRFALAQATLNRLSTPPTADYQYAYQLPNDVIRILSAGNGYKSSGLNYKIVQDKLYTNADNVIISYISRPIEESFPSFFVTALIAKLAAEFCLPLTESTTRTDYMKNLAEEEIKAAKLADSQQSVPSCFQDFSLIEVRQ